MKKFFRRIAIVVCLICLFTAPCTAMASQSSLTLVVNRPDAKIYQYLPDPCDIQLNGGFSGMPDLLNNNYSDGWWHASAGQNFTFTCRFKYPATYNYMVLVNGNTVALQQNAIGYGFSYDTGVLTTDAKIEAYVWATDNTYHIYLDTFSGEWR